MIASLSMYERPETYSALDDLWAATRHQLIDNGIDCDEALSRHRTDMDFWADPQLVLSQTCGLPFRADLHTKVSLVGAPDLRLEGCKPGYYRSVIVVRANDERRQLKEFEHAQLAINGLTSQSGFAALKHHWLQAGLAWPLQLHLSGGHKESAQAVADGTADLAAIDIVTYQLLERFDAFTSTLRVLEQTDPTPALPFICAFGFEEYTIATALKHGIDSLSAEQQQLLGLYGVVNIPAEDYFAVPTPPESQAQFSQQLRD